MPTSNHIKVSNIAWTVGPLDGAMLGNDEKVIESPQSIGDELYRHHSQVVSHNGTVYASWSCHDSTEDGTGQYVRWAASNDGGESWVRYGVMFPAMDRWDRGTMTPYTPGRTVKAERWVKANGSLYAIGNVNDLGNGPHGVEIKIGRGVIARKVTGTTLGTIFWIHDNPPLPLPGFTQYPDASDPAFSADATAIRAVMSEPQNKPMHAYYDVGGGIQIYPSQAIPMLVEPTSCLLTDGSVLRFWRRYSGDGQRVLWASVVEGGNEAPPIPTQIPNDPSRAFVLTLSDGRVTLIGNLANGQNRRIMHIASSRDGMQWNWWRKVHELAATATDPWYRVYTNDSRGGGQQYPGACEHNGVLFISSTIRKESVRMFRIPIAAIG